jgi:hypothetical protein
MERVQRRTYQLTTSNFMYKDRDNRECQKSCVAVHVCRWPYCTPTQSKVMMILTMEQW